MESKVNFLRKRCVGCNSVFVVISGLGNSALYCTSSCEDQHTIFNGQHSLKGGVQYEEREE